MTACANSPKTLKAGLVLIGPESATVQRIIALQDRPEKLTRNLQASTADGDVGNRLPR